MIKDLLEQLADLNTQPITQTLSIAATPIPDPFHSFNESLRAYDQIINMLGQGGQFVAALIAVVAIFYSWQSLNAIREEAMNSREEAVRNRDEAERNREEAVRSRKSFEFSWQPQIEVSFEAHHAMTNSAKKPVLPFSIDGDDELHRMLPSNVATIVRGFSHWRKEFTSEDYQNIRNPHEGYNYLYMNVRNNQSNLAGQAINLVITININYDEESYHVPDIMGNRSKNREEPLQLSLKLDRLTPSQKAMIPIAFITSVPNLRVEVKGIRLETWDHTILYGGVAGGIDFKKHHLEWPTLLLPNELIEYDHSQVITLEPTMYEKQD